ncbi:low-density lipoprotein receptor-related protein 1B [Sarcoptes scabiei]|nr:low-density lipoprotein receptor-related protein 1B [Sarcoptes scabiei]
MLKYFLASVLLVAAYSLVISAYDQNDEFDQHSTSKSKQPETITTNKPDTKNPKDFRDIAFTDCGNHELLHVRLTGCRGSIPCVLYRKTVVQLTAIFKSNQNTTIAVVGLQATLPGGLELPVPGVDTNACHHEHCPITCGSLVTFTYPWVVPKFMPQFSNLTLKAYMEGEHGRMACGIITNVSIR